MVELMPDPEADRVIKPALRSFHDSAHVAFVPPNFGAIRAQSRSRHRRRFAVAVGAVATVVAVAGVATGTVLVNSTVTHPPPVATQSPDAAPSSQAPSPSESPPSPAPTTPGRAITDTDWPNATITMGPSPDNEYCPAGPVRFHRGEATFGGRDVWMWKNAEPSYGDLDGDGAPEAVLPLACAPAEGGDDWSGNLVVVALQRAELTVLGYAGPLGARYSSYRVADGRLVTQVRPMHDAWAPEQRRAYEWNGTRFRQVAGYTTFLDLRNAEVAMDPVPDGDACPGGTVRFRDGAATIGPASYQLGAGKPAAADPEAQFSDLTGDGNAELLLPIRCTSAGLTGGGLYVLTLHPDGGYSVLSIAFVSYPWGSEGHLWYTLEDYQLSGRTLGLVTRNQQNQAVEKKTLRWNGKNFA